MKCYSILGTLSILTLFVIDSANSQGFTGSVVRTQKTILAQNNSSPGLTNGIDCGGVQNACFGGTEFHKLQDLTKVWTAGFIIGYVTFFGLLIFAMVVVIYDIRQRHQDNDQKLEQAEVKMAELGINKEQVDTQYQQQVAADKKHFKWY